MRVPRLCCAPGLCIQFYRLEPRAIIMKLGCQRRNSGKTGLPRAAGSDPAGPYQAVSLRDKRVFGLLMSHPLWKKHGWSSSSPSPGPPRLPFGRSPPYRREGRGRAGVRRSVSSFDFLVCVWGKEEMYFRISEHLCFVSLCVYLKKTFKKKSV